MIVDAKFVNVDALEVEITIKMTLGQWRKLHQQMPDEYPAYDIRRSIANVVRNLEQQARINIPDSVKEEDKA